MADTDLVRELADRLMRVPYKKRRRSLNGLVRGMEGIFRDLPEEPSPVDDDYGGDDDDEPTQAALEALQARLDAEGIDDPFDLPAVSDGGFGEVFSAAEDVLDQDPDDVACVAVATAVVALRTLLGARNLPPDRLEALQEMHIDNKIGE